MKSSILLAVCFLVACSSNPNEGGTQDVADVSSSDDGMSSDTTMADDGMMPEVDEAEVTMPGEDMGAETDEGMPDDATESAEVEDVIAPIECAQKCEDFEVCTPDGYCALSCTSDDDCGGGGGAECSEDGTAWVSSGTSMDCLPGGYCEIIKTTEVCDAGSQCINELGGCVEVPQFPCADEYDCWDGQGLCLSGFFEGAWQADGTCVDGVCSMSLVQCDEGCEAFVLNDGSVSPACIEDHYCSTSNDCDDENSCTDDWCMYSPQKYAKLCGHAYNGDDTSCQLVGGTSGQCFAGKCVQACKTIADCPLPTIFADCSCNGGKLACPESVATCQKGVCTYSDGEKLCEPGFTCEEGACVSTMVIASGTLTITDNEDQPDVVAVADDCAASFLFSMDDVEDGVLESVTFINLDGGGAASVVGESLELVTGYTVLGLSFVKLTEVDGKFVQRVQFPNLKLTLPKVEATKLCLRFPGSMPEDLAGKSVHFQVYDWEAAGKSSMVKIGDNKATGKEVTILP